RRPLLAAVTVPAVASVVRRMPAGWRRRQKFVDTLLNARDPVAASETADPHEQRAIDDLGPLTRAPYQSFHHDSLPRLLRKFDVHAMGHGIEARMPFLAWRLVR